MATASAPACPTALAVGTLLSAVNQGSVILSGNATAGTWTRVAVNYVVPVAVATVSYLSARQARVQPTPDGAESLFGRARVADQHEKP